MSALQDIVGTIAQIVLSVAPRTPPPLPPWHANARRSNAFTFVMRAGRAEETHPAYLVAVQQAPSGQSLRMVAHDEWFAVALYASGDTLSYRQLVRIDGVWRARGGGGGGGGGGGPERILTASTGAGWSTPVRNPGAVAYAVVQGTVSAGIERVRVEFDDGHLEDAVVGDGMYVWFYARRPPPRRPPSSHPYVRELLGADPMTVIGLSRDGRELARQDLPRPSFDRRR
jgi:hypothetical protein